MSVDIYGKPGLYVFVKKQKHCVRLDIFHSAIIKLKKDFTREELFEQFPGAKTFPQIKIHGQVIGGYEQLVTYIEETGYNGTGHSLGT